MKILSILQPWASLIVNGFKIVETRSWQTQYRGEILIHASARKPDRFKSNLIEDWVLKYRAPLLTPENYPTGVIIGKVKLMDIFPTAEASPKLDYIEFFHKHNKDQELEMGDYTPGRYGWLLYEPVIFKTPVPFKGQLGLRDVPADIIKLIPEINT